MLSVNNNHNRAYVHHPNGRVQAVRNLGWVRRKWQGIARFEWIATPPREGYPMSPDGVFKVFMRDGRVYITEYASFHVWQWFIDRSIFRGLPVRVNGMDGTV